MVTLTQCVNIMLNTLKLIIHLQRHKKKAERDEKFKERIIKDRKPGLFDRLFG